MTREDIIELDKLIARLRDLKASDRDIDYDIAQLMGWRQVKLSSNVVWLVPNSDETAKVPRFTKFLHDAYNLAIEVAPDHVGGASWEPNGGSARINDEPYMQACSPSVALCIAALTLRRKQYVAAYHAKQATPNAT